MTSDTVADLDVTVLGRYLERHVASFSGLQSATKFAGGQSNPTFLLVADSGSYVLRRQPPGQLLRSAHAVDREFRVLQALADSEVPVARVWHLCEDTTVIGSLFYLMSYEQGDIFWDPALPEIAPAARRDYYREAIRILAAIHNVDVARAGLSDFGRPGNYFQRQLDRWQQQYRAAETETKADMEQLMRWLQAHCPEDDGTVALVHGDYRLDNLIFQPAEPRGQAVLDWELATLGHPLADLAYFCMCLRLPPSRHSAGLGGLNRQPLGLPEEQEIVDYYCDLRSIAAIANWHFYLAFSFFRLASIVQGVYRRALAGNASNKNALETGQLVDLLAAMALDVIAQHEN